MKKALNIFLLSCLTCLGTATAQNALGCMVFQPDNRTTNLSAEDVNTIWTAIENMASASATVMSRQGFLELTNTIGLLPTGSNLRNDNNMRNKLIQTAPSSLIFTRITRWGSHFNVSMEKISMPDFVLTRATLPLSAKISTLEQLLDKLPGLMNQLGLVEKVTRPLDKPLMLLIPPAADKPLQTFCTALQKHLSEAGVAAVVRTQDAAGDGIRISVVIDTFENTSQTMDLPMQKRQLVKTAINLSGKMSMTDGNKQNTFSFSKSDSRTGAPEASALNENDVLDAVARDSAMQIIRKLNAKSSAP
ncbi:MAG: hypothetical protein IKN52_00595 [Victivallales bacterium]|nr:hypothetical protein [Victivallales bacterium]MBR6075127.1 hypothetical protein [Victivallales bacterium]